MAVNQEAEKPEDEDEFVDELKPGTELLQGQYKITKFINSGGFGITYLAKDSLDRDIVIKECFPSAFCRRSKAIVGARSRAHQNEFKSIVKLFVQEAKSQAKLEHPNIVGVHQVFEDNDTAYMALDFIKGSDLLEIIEDKKVALTPDNIVSMLRKLLDAVRFVHERGVLHRDISPDNVLVNSSGEPILIDFGAAREQASSKSRALSALRVVKDGYSPQEFYIAGSSQSDSSDLYALAATFYHVITGEAPPNSQARLASIAENSEDTYEPLEGRYEGYPKNFLSTLDKAIKVLPKDRIQSAQEWLDILDGKIKEDHSDKPVEASIARLLADEKGKKPAKAAAAPKVSDPSKPKAEQQIKVALSAEPKKKSMGVLLGSAAVVAIIAGIAVTQFMPGEDNNLATTPATETTEVAETETVTPPVEPEVEPAEETVSVDPAPEEITPEATENTTETVATEEPPVSEEPEAAEVLEPTTPADPETTEQEEAVVPEDIVPETETAIVEEQPALEEDVVPEVVETAEPEVAEPVEPEVVEPVEPEVVEAAEPEVAEPVEPEVAETVDEPAIINLNLGSNFTQPEDPVAESVGDAVAESTATQEDAPEQIETAEAQPNIILFGSPEPRVQPQEQEPVAVEEPVENTSVASDQISSAEWRVEVPFQTQQVQTENGEFPAITEVSQDVSSIPSGEWISEGVVIYAVNGDWVTGGVSIEELLLRSRDIGQKQFAYANVRIKTSENAQFEYYTLAVSTYRDLVLKNGVSFRVSYTDGQWRTVVTGVSDPSVTDFKEGDILVSDASTGRKLSISQSIEFLLNHLSGKGQEVAEFVVDRGGFETTAKMTLVKGE